MVIALKHGALEFITTIAPMKYSSARAS